MSNLFSSFDPQVSVFSFSLSLNWISAMGGLMIFPQLFWVTKNQLSGSASLMIKGLLAELMAVFGSFITPGSVSLFVSLFFFILTSNFLGLFPYVFTGSSHLVFTLMLSLPLWLGSMLMASVYQFNSVMAHLVPSGTPSALMPAMVLIESISSIIRPFTLAVRLAANMIAGHLLLALLGGQGSTNLSVSSGLTICALILLLMLECAVACIQSYVFTILSSLYLSELTSVSMNKTFI